MRVGPRFWGHARTLDAATGAEQWRYEPEAPMDASPAIAAGTVYLNTKYGLHAIDAATGERRFHSDAA